MTRHDRFRTVNGAPGQNAPKLFRLIADADIFESFCDKEKGRVHLQEADSR